MLTPEQLKSIDRAHQAMRLDYVERLKRGLDPERYRYDAWAEPVNSKKYRMRGIRGCNTCKGMGYAVWSAGTDWPTWIRCWDCRSKMATAGEKRMALGIERA